MKSKHEISPCCNGSEKSQEQWNHSYEPKGWSQLPEIFRYDEKQIDCDQRCQGAESKKRYDSRSAGRQALLGSSRPAGYQNSKRG